MTDDSLSPEDSMKIINQMIASAKQRYMAINVFFILWGIVIFLAGIGFYVLAVYTDYQYPYIVWIILPTIGGILSSIIGRRQEHYDGPTFIDRVIFITWTGFSIALIVTIFINVYHKSSPSVDIMLLTGMATLISGYIIRFKPLIIGGISFWVCALITTLFLEDYSPIMTSVSVLIGYLIPGLLLKRKEKAGA